LTNSNKYDNINKAGRGAIKEKYPLRQSADRLQREKALSPKSISVGAYVSGRVSNICTIVIKRLSCRWRAITQLYHICIQSRL